MIKLQKKNLLLKYCYKKEYNRFLFFNVCNKIKKKKLDVDKHFFTTVG